MFFLYNLLLILTAPFWAPWMLWRTSRRKERPNWRERRGDYQDSMPEKGSRPRLWVHTVSVGEFVAAQPLLRELRSRLPEHEIVLSVTTSSGHGTAREAKERLYDHLVYLPLDLASFTRAAMRRVRPDALIVLETELWMNLFRAARGGGARIFVVNARLSDRSFPKASRLGFFYRPLLGMVRRVLAQSETDAERFRALGAKDVEATGNLKFDQALDGLDDATDWRRELGLDGRAVVVVGSLRAEEFGGVARAISTEPTWQWVVAPRHLERTGEFVAALDEARAGGGYGYRSRGTYGGVTILDTYGELARVYRVADVAVIGGSFAKVGMQNLIQPLAHGKPVLHGPYTQNFRDVADLAKKAGASIVCEDANDLVRQLHRLIDDPERRARMGEAARALVEANRGASARMAEAILSSI